MHSALCTVALWTVQGGRCQRSLCPGSPCSTVAYPFQRRVIGRVCSSRCRIACWRRTRADETAAEVARLHAENAALRQRVGELERLVGQLEATPLADGLIAPMTAIQVFIYSDILHLDGFKQSRVAVMG